MNGRLRRLLCWLMNHEARRLHWRKPDASIWCYAIGETVYRPSQPEPLDVTPVDPYLAGLLDETKRIR